MSVKMYHEAGRVMTTTNSLRGNKECMGCHLRFVVVERGQDGKWYCLDCLGIDEPLIYEVPADATDD